MNERVLGMDWKLVYAHHDAFKEWEKQGSSEAKFTIFALENSGMKVLDATVPGNFELDLMREGLVEDLYYSVNTLKAQELEDVHVCYFTKVKISSPEQFLHFEGIDTFADIYVNGKKVLSTENMFLPYDVEADWKIGENQVVVHIKPAMLEARKMVSPALCFHLRYNYPALYTRKAAHMYGWDIMPRIVSAGIWKEVSLRSKKTDVLKEVYLATLSVTPEEEDRSYGEAWIQCYLHTELSGAFAKEYKVVVEGRCGEHTFRQEDVLWHNTHGFSFRLQHCKLWWPRRYGEPSLYQVKVTLYRGDCVCDETQLEYGIRTTQLVRSAYTDEAQNGEFCFRINGKKVFVLGSNWVPLDAFHSRDLERLDPAMEMLVDLDCNMVRCWGGNVYESDAFYQACDRNGLMIWQDFSMACGNYPRESAFAEALSEEAVYVVKRLRNHASVVLWSGDNECDAMQPEFGVNLDPNRNFLTRQILRQAVENHDYVTPYLSSSPFISEEVHQGKGTMPEMHLWGPRDYFKGSFYKDTFCHFASETGYHGFPSLTSLKRFLQSPEVLWKEEDIPTDEYLVHAACMEMTPGMPYHYRIKLAYDQVMTLFGQAEPEFEDFIKQSQISQAEAKKYFIEKFRIGKGKRSGIIWWNLLDGWPQVSDAVVDYYFCKKLAYHYIKRSQERVCLMVDEPVAGQSRLVAVNDRDCSIPLTYKVYRLQIDTVHNTVTKEEVLQGQTVLSPDSVTSLEMINIREENRDFYWICWEADGKEGSNHYVSNLLKIQYQWYMLALKACGMEQFEGLEPEEAAYKA